MPRTPTILVVDDDAATRAYMRSLLELHPCRVELATSGADAVAHLKDGLVPDLVLLDMNMPGLDGLETLPLLSQAVPSIRVVMVSCVTDTKKVVRAMQLGAADYLPKPVQQQDLEKLLADLTRNQPTVDDTSVKHADMVRLSDDMMFVCASQAMRKVRSQVGLVASCDIPVLILGESGTGKEVIATLVHQMSPRAQYPFVKVNCAAVPNELLESELFGYEAGAFTGAVKAKPGKFELCDKGTILLDEIGEMSPSLQAKLLHVLQDHEFSRLGARNSIKADVRVIAATNVDVRQAIAEKTLRSDLYYRLNGITLRLPPLRDRREEIPLLLKYFIAEMAEKFARPAPPVSQRMIQACISYPWPGNLRELQNFVKRYIVLCDEELAISELSGEMEAMGSSGGAQPGMKLKSIVRSVKAGAEAIAISDALRQTDWKRKKAAALLGISYKALLYKMRQFGIEPPPKASPEIGPA